MNMGISENSGFFAEDTGLWLKPRTFEVFPVIFAAKRNYAMLWKSQIKELG